MKHMHADDLPDDWNRMIATIADFCAKHDLPKPDVIFAPQVFSRIQSTVKERLLPTLINRGVRVRFGKFEQSDVFRSL